MTGRIEYLRAADIVRLTGMSLRTIRRLIADEIIPSTKLGGARLVARADLERLRRGEEAQVGQLFIKLPSPPTREFAFLSLGGCAAKVVLDKLTSRKLALARAPAPLRR
jgi:excisionase family DNA binding protein